MADEKKKGDEETELEIVGEGAEPEEGEEKAKAKGKETDEESGDDEGGEEEQATGHSDDDGEERPRKKKSRHERERASRNRDRKEIEFLTIRNQQLEQRFGDLETRTVQNERVAIDQRISLLRSQIDTADEVIATAIEKGSGKDEREANRIRERLKDSLTRLEAHKRSIESNDEGGEPSQRQGTGATARPQVPVEVMVNARVWRKANPWWKPGGRDEDSTEVTKIDDQLVKEGYDPRGEEYWEELTARAKEALPHRYEDDDGEADPRPKTNGAKKKNGGPKFSTGGREVSLKPNQVHVSAARKAAMVEAGVWDDLALRQKYLKQYAKYDREHASRS